MSATIPASTVLRFRDLHNRVKLSRSTLREKIANGTFPAPIQLGQRAIGWLESDIEAWVQARIKANHKEAP